MGQGVGPGGAGQDLYQGIKGPFLMVLRDDFCQQLVLALGQLDEGTDAVDVGIGLHVQHVISPWGDSSAAELLVWGQPSPCCGGMGVPRRGGGKLFWQKAGDSSRPDGFKEKTGRVQPFSWLLFQLWHGQVLEVMGGWIKGQGRKIPESIFSIGYVGSPD